MERFWQTLRMTLSWVCCPGRLIWIPDLFENIVQEVYLYATTGYR